MGYSRTRYTQDFKDNAVAMYYEIRNAKKVADNLGVSHYAVQSWIKKANERKQPQATSDINPLLLSMAQGNDLTPYIGKDITKMQPREIYAFLRLLNIHGKITTTNTIEL